MSSTFSGHATEEGSAYYGMARSTLHTNAPETDLTKKIAVATLAEQAQRFPEWNLKANLGVLTLLVFARFNLKTAFDAPSKRLAKEIFGYLNNDDDDEKIEDTTQLTESHAHG